MKRVLHYRISIAAGFVRKECQKTLNSFHRLLSLCDSLRDTMKGFCPDYEA